MKFSFTTLIPPSSCSIQYELLYDTLFSEILSREKKDFFTIFSRKHDNPAGIPFSGAHQRDIGFCEQAYGVALFLDEISEMDYRTHFRKAAFLQA